MLLNQALKLMRVYHHMTQADVAKKLEVTTPYVSEIEAGNKTPSFEVLEKYAKAFSIPLSSIMFFAENVDNPSGVSKTETYIAGKVISLLQFIAERAEDQDKEEQDKHD